MLGDYSGESKHINILLFLLDPNETLGASKAEQRRTETEKEEEKRTEAKARGSGKEEASRGDTRRVGRVGRRRGSHQQTEEAEDQQRAVRSTVWSRLNYILIIVCFIWSIICAL